MARLLYVTNTSLDWCIEDEHGALDFSEPDEEVFDFIAELVRPVGTYLYGRRLYETMSVWETDPEFREQPFGTLWQAAEKVVYSTTLPSVPTARTRLERAFDPDAVRDLKAAATADLTIGGAELAAHAFRHGVVDECHLLVRPLILGGGKPALPPGTRVQLELLDERRFATGTLYLRYRTSAP